MLRLALCGLLGACGPSAPTATAAADASTDAGNPCERLSGTYTVQYTPTNGCSARTEQLTLPFGPGGPSSSGNTSSTCASTVDPSTCAMTDHCGSDYGGAFCAAYGSFRISITPTAGGLIGTAEDSETVQGCGGMPSYDCTYDVTLTRVP